MDKRRPVKDLDEMDFIANGTDEPVWVLSNPTPMVSMPYTVLKFFIDHGLVETANPADVNNYSRNNPTQLQSERQRMSS